MDFSEHNEEVRRVWQAYRAGKPVRAPMALSVEQRWWVLDPELNPSEITWHDYLNDPETMFQVCLKFKYALAHRIPQDVEMGVPADAWEITPHFANIVDEAWLGSELVEIEGQTTTTRPAFSGEHKYEILERGIPDPFDGIMGQVLEYYEYFKERANGYEFFGRPVRVGFPQTLNSDGLLTVAHGLRGPELFEDMLVDEDYYYALMDLVTSAMIRRIQTWRVYLGVEPRPTLGWFADDAIQFISTAAYREKVMPYHKRFMAALFGAGPHGMHLCGNVQRHLPLLVKEFNVKSFDTGFPLNFTTLRAEVGEDVEILGGVKVPDLLACTAGEIFARTRDILTSGILRGGKFILKEANDLAPRVPLANLEAMYAAVKQFGVYPSD
jgi:hypothetical protein